ncbi:Cryptochrome/photolyase FAD-binding domain-containing protein [Myriangium duriaei CBS 260.36]|uniref:Cryptochrome/photolyase FAD-binding domain-containing protein n=1 Tax=Myriangium duriaei CBS 260.36 TaxID=1168546 RepID=A0A9P4J8A9_9PEZI|nr:Cryptochrome/photolyase FAD-binding domain-containing protein [Myriangium duriaei CBS 260.36]
MAPRKFLSSNNSNAPRVIYWFRTDLRLHDSPALHAALDLKPSVLYPIWTWDPHYVYRARVGQNRFQFLIDCQNDVSSSLTKLNPKQKLLVIREAPQTLIPKLIKEWRITHLVFEKDTDAYARSRDKEVINAAEEAGVKVIIKSGRTLWDSDEVVKQNGGKPTMSMTQLEAAGKKVGDIANPLPTPKKLPDPGDTKLSFDQNIPVSSPDFSKDYREGEEKSYKYGLSGPNKDFGVPTLEELGLQKATTPHKGGESQALSILDTVTNDAQYTATFEKPKTSPAAFDPQSTCLTSPHLHFGSLSVREFWWRVQKVLDGYKGTPSQPPTSLHGQLLFRDMYFGAQAALGWQFGQTYDNSHCRFVPWHLPSKVDLKTGLITGEYEVDDKQAEEYFIRWREGRTGFPWIDALMRQLRQEGWIHHLGRHSVACFLTRGGCYVSWERGAEVFEELLIDHEAACNIGNWQWLSCTAFFSQFYRCYSPVAFGQKWDKEGNFIRRYVPELKDVPAKYIYEPWKTPIADQKKAKVQIKGDGSTEKDGDVKLYPKPMLDFNHQRQVCIDGMKAAYDVKLYGNSKEVKDGTWSKLFDDHGEGLTQGTKGGPGGTMGEHEDATGHEEGEPHSTKTPNGNSSVKAKGSGGAAGGGKREQGQGTLDGSVKRMKNE